MSTLTIKSALANLSTACQGVRNAALYTTAAILIVKISHDSEKQTVADTAIKNAVMQAGMYRMDKGTKQPSGKARHYMGAASQAYKLHQDKARSIIAASPSIEDATAQLAAWLDTFSLSRNLYEGGTFLLPLTRGISKKDAKALVIQKQEEGESAGEDDSVNKLAPRGKAKPATAKGVSTAQEAHEVLSATVTASAVLPMLKTLLSAKASKDTSAAIVRMLSELDAINRLVRGEEVKSCSKEARALAVLAGKHGAFFAKQVASAKTAKQSQEKAIVKRASKAGQKRAA